MSDTLQKLIDVINILKKDQPTIVKENNQDLNEQLDDLIANLNTKRKEFLDEKFSSLKQNIKDNYKRLRVPLLSLIQYDWHENSHSNILQYLVDYNSFEHGSNILSEIIKSNAGINLDDLPEKILKNTYTVHREYHIGNGRIDLFITDAVEKFVIIIENKLLAPIGKIIDDNDDNTSITQLIKYEKWCVENYHGYHSILLLLYLKDVNDNSSSFIKFTYKELHSILKKFNSDDNVFNEYVLLLDTLVNPLPINLSELKIMANEIITDEELKITLTDYYTLQTIFYEK